MEKVFNWIGLLALVAVILGIGIGWFLDPLAGTVTGILLWGNFVAQAILLRVEDENAQKRLRHEASSIAWNAAFWAVLLEAILVLVYLVRPGALGISWWGYLVLDLVAGLCGGIAAWVQLHWFESEDLDSIHGL